MREEEEGEVCLTAIDHDFDPDCVPSPDRDEKRFISILKSATPASSLLQKRDGKHTARTRDQTVFQRIIDQRETSREKPLESVMHADVRLAEGYTE